MAPVDCGADGYAPCTLGYTKRQRKVALIVSLVILVVLLFSVAIYKMYRKSRKPPKENDDVELTEDVPQPCPEDTQGPDTAPQPETNPGGGRRRSVSPKKDPAVDGTENNIDLKKVSFRQWLEQQLAG